MKSRMNIMLIAIAVMLVAVTWVVARGQKTAILAATTAAPTPVVQIRVQAVPAAEAPAKPAVAGAGVERTQSSLATTLAPPAETAPAATQPATGNTAAALAQGDKPGYTAVAGDTLSNVAAGLLGSDSKKNRDTVVAGSPSLQADPDRVLTGKTYQLPTPPSVPQTVTEAKPEPSIVPAPAPAAVPVPQSPTASDTVAPKADRVMKYTAQPGDSVSALAAGLLGADSKVNRDAIINENKSLQRDPDHVEVGKAYKIPAGDGLAAAPVQAADRVAAPSTQPDADQVVKVGANRELRYTARAGDTVSKLAEVLLGSDTPANRDAIIGSNASLKSDPDRVIAGQTYWIPAPAAVVSQP